MRERDSNPRRMFVNITYAQKSNSEASELQLTVNHESIFFILSLYIIVVSLESSWFFFYVSFFPHFSVNWRERVKESDIVALTIIIIIWFAQHLIDWNVIFFLHLFLGIHFGNCSVWFSLIRAPVTLNGGIHSIIKNY